MSVEIIPAIIPKSFSELKEKLSLVVGLVPFVQIDISDGKFTENKTWPNIFNPDPDFVKIIKEEEGFPYWEDLDFEIHLMVSDPESLILQWVSAGAKRIIFHFESFEDQGKVVAFVRGFKDKFGGDGSFLSTELGMALNLDTDISAVEGIIEGIDSIQCMGIKNIGFQGQSFDEGVFAKIKALRSAFPEIPISVDGGVSLENGRALIESGATRLVVGNALFGSDDIAGTIEEFRNL